MHHLISNLPIVGTLGVVAIVVGSLPRLLIFLGASLLEHLFRGRVSSSPRPRGDGIGSLSVGVHAPEAGDGTTQHGQGNGGPVDAGRGHSGTLRDVGAIAQAQASEFRRGTHARAAHEGV
jgi:hypothetical protein